MTESDTREAWIANTRAQEALLREKALVERQAEEMEAFAAKHGLAALLDHLGLDGLGNEVVELRARAGQRCGQPNPNPHRDNLYCGLAPGHEGDHLGLSVDGITYGWKQETAP